MFAIKAIIKENTFNILKAFNKAKQFLFSPGIEPGTFCVLDRCDNRYTTKTSIR